MLSVIKTAIITIIISFISGVLLDTYKNYAPRILCIMGKGVPIQLNGRRIKAYNLKVKNISSKTLHDLNVCIQGNENNMSMDEARITGGLRFDVSKENSMINVSIPFLSKDDVFNVKLFMENIRGGSNRPVITLRSPENFKRIGKGEKKGLLGSLLSIPEGIETLFEGSNACGSDMRNSNDRRERNSSHNTFFNKKVLTVVFSLILVLSLGWIGIEKYNDLTGKSQGTQANINVKQPESTSSTSSISGNNGSTGSASSISGNSGSKSADTSKSSGSSTKTSQDKSDSSQEGSTKASFSEKGSKSDSTEITNNSKTNNNSNFGEDKNMDDTKAAEEKTSQNKDNNSLKNTQSSSEKQTQSLQNNEQSQNSNENVQTKPESSPSSSPSEKGTEAAPPVNGSPSGN